MKNLNSKVLCSLDWLSVTYAEDIFTTPANKQNPLPFFDVPGYYVQIVGETNVFAERYFIFNSKGIKVLTYLRNPKSKIIKSNIGLLEFANHTLYSNEWSILLNLFPKFRPGVFVGISRIDICADFQNYFNGTDLEPAQCLAQMLYHQNYFVQKIKSSTFFCEKIEKYDNTYFYNVVKQISFGNKTSNFKWKLYNKTKEIVENSNKDYLLQLFKDFGFDPDVPVWRLEVSITGANRVIIKEKNGDVNLLSLSQIQKPENIPVLFQILQRSKFIVRFNQNNPNTSRNKLVPIFGTGCTGYILFKEAILQHLKPADSIAFVKKNIPFLTDGVLSWDNRLRLSLFEQIKYVVREFNLYEDFQKITDLDIQTFEFNYIQNNKSDLKINLNSQNYVQREIKFN